MNNSVNYLIVKMGCGPWSCLFGWLVSWLVDWLVG